MSFLTTTKIIGRRIRLTDTHQYVAELFIFGLIGVAYVGWDDLAPIRAGIPTIHIEKNAFVFIAAPGLHAIRLSSFVAMARDFRMPQVIEWWVFIIPTAAMVACFALSGTLVNSYAVAHHYRFCYRQHDRATTYIFARAAGACPPLPAGAVPY